MSFQGFFNGRIEESRPFVKIAGMSVKVLFVCSGNQCRSPFAEAVMKKLLEDDPDCNIEVSSAGTISMGGEPAAPDAVRLANECGLDLKGHSARRLTADMIEEYDMILVMENAHRDSILRMNHAARDKISMLGLFAPSAGGDEEIPDPMGAGPLAYRTCFSRIIESVRGLYASLCKKESGRYDKFKGS